MPAVGQAVREQVKVEVDSEPFWGVPKTGSGAESRIVVPVSNPSFRTADGSWQDEGYRGIPSTNFTSVKTPGMGEWSYEFPAYPNLVGFYLGAMMGVEAVESDVGVQEVQEVWFGITTANASSAADKKFRLTIGSNSTADLTFTSAGQPPSAATVQAALRAAPVSETGAVVVGLGTFESPYTILFGTAGTRTQISISDPGTAGDKVPETIARNARTLRDGRAVSGVLHKHTFSLLGGGGTAQFQPAGRPNTVVPPSLTHYYGQGVRVDRFAGSLISQLEMSWNAGEGALMFSVEGQSQRQVRLDPNTGFALNTAARTAGGGNPANAGDINIGGSPFMGYTSAVMRGGEFDGRIMSATHTFTRELTVIHTGDGSSSLQPDAIRVGGLGLRSSFVLNYVDEGDLNDYLMDRKENFETRYTVPTPLGGTVTNDALVIKSSQIAYNIEPASEDLGEAAPRLNLTVVHLFNTEDFGPCVIELTNSRAERYIEAR